MIESSECKEFLFRRVGVGLPHLSDSTKIFYYYGTLLSVTTEYVKIKMRNGYKQIPLEEIIEIKLAEEAQL